MANPTPLYYVTTKNFEDKIGRELVVAILDDNNDGSPDAGPVLRLLLDAVAYVESFMRAAGYDLEKARAASPPPSDVVRLVLERAHAMANIRHPEIVRYDGEKALLRVERECLMIQKKIMRLDLNLTDAAPAGVGGRVGRIGMSATAPSPMFADLGDFPGSRVG